ncbi:hypothetical protein V1478_018704, partial [Vespula squamosa]
MREFPAFGYDCSSRMDSFWWERETLRVPLKEESEREKDRNGRQSCAIRSFPNSFVEPEVRVGICAFHWVSECRWGQWHSECRLSLAWCADTRGSLPPRRNRASAEQTQTKSGLGGASSLTSSDIQTNGTDVETNARGESPEPPLCRASYSYEATTWDPSTAKP